MNKTMKIIKKIFQFIIVLLLSLQIATAQSSEMERDIRIAERILQEMFTYDTEDPIFQIPNLNRVQGEYIPGVGVHFRIGHQPDFRVTALRVRRDTNQERTDFQKIDSDWVEARMLDYFSQYGGQIRGLQPDEQVRLTFSPRNLFIGVVRSGRELDIPRLTMWISSADLQRHTRNNLSADEFRNHVQSYDLTQAEEKQDLVIFASVLETALNNTGSDHLRVSRKPTFEYLPGLGAQYQISVNAGRGFPFVNLQNIARSIDDMNLDNVEIEIDLGDITHSVPDEDVLVQMPRIEMKMDTLRISLQRHADSLRFDMEKFRRDLEDVRIQTDTARRQGEEIRRQFEFRYAERDTVNLEEDVQIFLTELNKAIADYGPTLRSLEGDELLMITVNWAGRNPTTPERTHIRIKKSDLLVGESPEIRHIERD
jgi:hypothetical protein